MTVPVPCPLPASDVPSLTPRKRRRRAPASGASDDCFACIKRNTKCDRRRPYCSQCLEVGNECSGYKTQLTWGVGVASRGKLRGLSLPVAKSAPAVKSMITKHARSATALHKHANSRDVARSLDGGDAKVKLEGQSALPSNGYTTYDFINMVPSPVQSQSIAADWTIPMPQEYVRSPPTSAPDQQNHQQILCQSLQRLQTPFIGQPDDINMGSPSGSMSAYSDTDYSPLGHSFSADDVPFLSSPMPMYHSYSGSPMGHSAPFNIIQEGRGPTSCPDQYYAQSEVSSSLGSHPAVFEMCENRQHAGSPHRSEVNYDDEISGAMSTSHGSEHFMGSPHSGRVAWHSGGDGYATPGMDNNARALPRAESFHIPLAPEISPRLGFFMDYYDKVICPATVAIDTPSNPYRLQILNLALESPSLQHAICALASCHMRMKQRRNQGQRRRLHQPFELEIQDRINGGFQLVSNVRNATIMDFASDGALDEPATQEEYLHRGRAVALLNQQLGDPNTACHDSVLATLLILCHYRMCESGIAQFKTQFAGVKKLLGMRACGVETGKWGWMETLFTFFDAVTATVNDREAQLRGGYLDMIASPSSPECALENLAGCDGSLFRIIALLGRLNLLSQRRPVLDPLRRQHESPHSPQRSDQPRPRLAGQALVDFYKYHTHKFDGNGFVNMLDDYDSDDGGQSVLPAYSPVPSSSHLPSTVPASVPIRPTDAVATADEARPQFLREWTATRRALQEWEFSSSALASALPVTPTAQQTRDFAYVSEAFRYAALLYIERLASPHLPSSNVNIQHLVSKALFFVRALEGSHMERFLLWPLFVLGSESVGEAHRNIVRTRCRVLSQHSGYSNNSAGLEVLEGCWREMDGEAVAVAAGADPKRNLKSRGQNPFRWTAWMEGLDGEILMV